MNGYDNFNSNRKIAFYNKKAKSSNRFQDGKIKLPSLKGTLKKENIYLNNEYLEIINHNKAKRKNHSQLHYQVQKNHKPYSGNPLKFHKRELGNAHGNKFYPEREIFTANPYLVGYNGKKKNLMKNNNNSNNINEFYNKYLIYSYSNNITKNQKFYHHPNNKNSGNNNVNGKNIILSSNPSLLIQNVNPKPNNKLRAQNKQKQNNNPNKIIIITNNNKLKQNINNINTGDEDAKYTLVNDKEIDLNMRDNNEENLHEEHLDLFFISYSYCEDANLEHRKEMEDFHYIKALLNKKLNCSYFGLFDGHSGKEVGHYLMQNLHKIISQEIKKNNNIENSDDMKEILKNSFEAIDKEINRQNFKNETGSTGTVLLLYKDNDSKTGKSLICANVGDSKAYLINKTEIKLITKDHKCSDADEVKRIRDTGGVVFRERVFGTLMLTRSFGDKEMKKYGVLSTPDIFCHNIEDDDLFIVIASDGVWDVVEEDEVFKFSQDKISSSEFSKKIIQLAKERDTHDNISCIVVKLNKNM